MEDKIKEIVKKELNANVNGIKKINEGYSHENFNVHIDEEPYEVIVRFSNKKEDKYTSLSKEKYVIEKLREKSIPAPKIYGFDLESEKQYLILQKFEGQRVSDLWNKVSRKEQIELAKKMGELLKKIHQIKFDKFGWIMKNGDIDYIDEEFHFKDQGEVQKTSLFLKENLRTYISNFGKLMATKMPSPEFASKVIKYVMQNIDEIEYLGEPTLIHGDFQTGHIFVEKENEEWNINGIIDLEFAESSSPDYDFIKLHREGLVQDKELKSALEETYGKINKKSVLVHRILRELAFARLVLESGNKELYEKTINNVEKMIDEDKQN